MWCDVRGRVRAYATRVLGDEPRGDSWHKCEKRFSHNRRRLLTYYYFVTLTLNFASCFSSTLPASVAVTRTSRPERFPGTASSAALMISCTSFLPSSITP